MKAFLIDPEAQTIREVDYDGDPATEKGLPVKELSKIVMEVL